jgi:SOS response regulatory protein OraA/RecX
LIAHYADTIVTIVKRSDQPYGTRRIRFALQQAGISVSGRDIAQVMKSLSLVSKYTIKRYRGYQTVSNSSVTANHLQRQFDVGSKQQIE